jgi:miniconductance mechanosensitive channel
MLTENTDIQIQIIALLSKIGINADTSSWQYTVAAILALFTTAIAVHIVTRLILTFKVVRLVGFTKNTWDNELLEYGVFRRLAHLVPGLVLYAGKFVVLPTSSPAFAALALLVGLYLIFSIYLALLASLTASEAIYSKSRLAKKAPITGFVQVAKLIITLAMVFLVISLLLGKSPIYLLSGLTAIAAVLLLIFRDTILGFVSGIQIAANRMFNTGDWIEIPKYGVDGDITEIGLTVVKVQNWDKTISTIPTYALTSDAVKNWRGMKDSGGRRIKRSIYIDMRTISFATQEQIEKWRKLDLISSYLNGKEGELIEDSKRCEASALDKINSRRLTNIGTFRAYVSAYIAKHPDLSDSLTRMVRQLAPSELGLPIEVYCFSKKQDWVEYEHIQSEMFDHLIAIMPTFGLSAYQRVTNSPKRLNDD